MLFPRLSRSCRFSSSAATRVTLRSELRLCRRFRRRWTNHHTMPVMRKKARTSGTMKMSHRWSYESLLPLLCRFTRMLARAVGAPEDWCAAPRLGRPCRSEAGIVADAMAPQSFSKGWIVLEFRALLRQVLAICSTCKGKKLHCVCQAKGLALILLERGLWPLASVAYLFLFLFRSILSSLARG